jgi:hypothetical protein
MNVDKSADLQGVDMSSSALMRGVVATVGAVAACFLLTCNQQAAVVGGTGGMSSLGGSGGRGGGDGGSGGSGMPDAEPVMVKLDTAPGWWGEADAQHEPDLPAVPTADANCGLLSSDTVRQSVDVLLVLDRSSSMDWSIADECYCATSTSTGTRCDDPTNCTTRWNALKPAVQTTLSTSKYVNWGLKFFTTPNTTGNCGVSKTMEVQVKPDAADEINSQIDRANLGPSTPTAAALTAATDYLKTVSDTNKRFILLATDGEPNCPAGGTWSTSDVTGASNAAAAALAAGFPVYVVGIGPSLDNLTALAKAGGTNDYYPVSSPEQLAQALSSIGKAVGSCTFQSKDAPPDPNNVAVYVNKQLIQQNADDGWKYGATPQEIELTGSYCEHITAGEDTSVQILFGCPGAPPFPPFVP